MEVFYVCSSELVDIFDFHIKYASVGAALVSWTE
jgi:hypothetical protein